MNFVPESPEEPLETIPELISWMEEFCNNFRSYAVSGNLIHEGHGIERNDHEFYWYYIERGSKQVVGRFKTESEVVRHAYEVIRKDTWSWSHMIAFVKAESTAKRVEMELSRRGVAFYSDRIPYGGLDDPRYRVFVFGCSVKGVNDLEIRE